MLLKRWLSVIGLTCSVLLSGCSRQTPAERAANEYAAREIAAAPVHSNLPDYSLPPDKLAKAQHLARVHVTMHFADEIWGVLQILLLLWLGVIAWMRDRALRAGYKWRTIGENIASGQRTAQEAVQGWLDSPGHCANIMNAAFAEMGVGYAVNPARGTLYWTQVLAR